MDEITSRLSDKTEFNVRQEYWPKAALLVTFLAVEKSNSPLGESRLQGTSPAPVWSTQSK
ncbi:hypothetical protein [Psychrosphaera algicola]|uniref:Uncharacterized protein n=1 Tax=Psychrosphaera algicola TaxID=3023714 RepID=A0ABT5FJF3_9GAMM|nr:hypothetical protein [Psychrosphaera sp. G1-22]MDC2891330.1 hypothetical protein [Psychrosphaera sp. G1-22]